jgi:hypothetical protein
MLRRFQPIERQIEPQDIDPGLADQPRKSTIDRAFATAATWPKAVSGETSWLSPAADAVTASAGTGPSPVSTRQASTPPFTRSTSGAHRCERQIVGVAVNCSHSPFVRSHWRQP